MENFIHDWGYIALFLYSFGGGMLGLAIAGVFASSGELNISYVLIIATISNFIGDQFLFTIARNNKEYAKKMMQKHKRKIALSHLMMRKYGWLSIIAQKYIYGIKTLIPLAIGLTKYDFKKFMVLNVMGAFAWVCAFGFGSYYAGDVLMRGYEVVLERPYIAPLIIIVMGGSIWLYMERVTRKKKR